MEKTNRELLIKDISSRLPYGVKAEVMGWDEEKEEEVFVPVTVYSVNTDGYVYFANNDYDITYCSIDACRLYLRPLSSMTEEEKNELSTVLNYEFYADDDFALVAEDDRHRIRLELCEGYIDWLNAHHFDYRGLIEKGLALEAKEGMYKTE